MAKKSTTFAVMAKARAKYGKRLKDKDYQNLLACKSVAEIMVYLKSYTHYADALKEVNEHDVHRGMLEKLLRQNLYYDFSSLCSYGTGVGSTFSTYITRKTEVELLMNYLTMLNSNSSEDFIFRFPAYFDKHASFDLNKIAKAKSYEEFLYALEKSPYYSTLSMYKADESSILPLNTIENRLYSIVYKDLFNGINKNCPKSEQNELLSLFNTILDYENFMRIIRLKKFYNMSPVEIKANLLAFGSLKDSQIDALCNAENSKEAFEIMSNFRQGYYINKTSDLETNNLVSKIKYKKSVKNIYYSSSPAAVMISYMYATEIELANITCLIEGARYNVDSKKIESLLIYQKWLSYYLKEVILFGCCKN